MRIVWNPVAKKNLRTIRDHYKQFNKKTARKVTKGIIFATRRLEDFPESGRVVPEISDPDFREVIWDDRRMIYEPKPSPPHPVSSQLTGLHLFQA